MNHTRNENDDREAEIEEVRAYHGADDYCKVNFGDGTGSGIAFSSTEDAQEYIDSNNKD